MSQDFLNIMHIGSILGEINRIVTAKILYLDLRQVNPLPGLYPWLSAIVPTVFALEIVEDVRTIRQGW